MNRVLEVIFRQFIKLLLLLVLLPAIGVAIAYFLPRSYQSSATLWALSSYQIIGMTGTQIDPQSNTPVSPAQSQVDALTELLNTSSFSLAVAKQSSLTPTLNLSASTLANPQLLDKAIFDEISHHVKVTTSGYETFSISYISRDPKVAQRVVEAVIQNYTLQTQHLSMIQAQNMLQSYQRQLAQAKQNLDAAISAQADYVASHPNLSGAALSTDPQYVFLQTQVQSAGDTYDAILKNIASLNQEIANNSSNNLFQVLDEPMPGLPVSRLITFLIAGAIGLALALTTSTLYILILLRRDQSVYSVADLQNIISRPVVMQVPHLAEAVQGRL